MHTLESIHNNLVTGILGPLVGSDGAALPSLPGGAPEAGRSGDASASGGTSGATGRPSSSSGYCGGSIAARVAKKADRNKKKNKARSGRRQRKREAMNSGGDKKGGRDVAPPPHMAWTSAPPEPAAPQSEARTQSEPRGALDAPSLAGEEGGNEMQKSTRDGDEDGEEKEEQVEFAFNFPLPKRERKPSDEEPFGDEAPKVAGEAGRAAGGAARRRRTRFFT